LRLYSRDKSKHKDDVFKISTVLGSNRNMNYPQSYKKHSFEIQLFTL